MSSGYNRLNLIGIDPEIGWFAPNQQGALVENWDFTYGNQLLTLYLRDDLEWSDGTPITAADVMMSYELALRPETNVEGEVGVRHLNTTIANVEALDEHTIRITFTTGSCTALDVIASSWKVLPAHIYRQLLDEVGYAGLWTHEWFQHPTVFSGPFGFSAVREDGSIILTRNGNYHDNTPGIVRPQHFVEVFVHAGEMDSVENFLVGEANVVDFVVLPRRQEYMDAAAAGVLQAYQYLENSFTFLALNQADPDNPQPALDEHGQRIEQGLHPIFGDKLTRQAIAHAIDVDSLIAETQYGFATRLTTQVVPNSWAINSDLPLIPYNPQLALTMLAEAGWIPENPDLPTSPQNRLICRDCLYAREVDAAFNGSYMEVELLKYAGRVPEIDMVAQQLSQVGVSIHLQEVEWDVFIERVMGQTFDAAYLGFFGAYPYNPATDEFFGPLADTPSNGFNFSSFYDEAYFALEATANTVPGCGLTERANIYRQMQEILYEEQPFVFLYTNIGVYAARNEVEGFAPYPNDLFWNVDTWTVHEAE